MYAIAALAEVGTPPADFGSFMGNVTYLIQFSMLVLGFLGYVSVRAIARRSELGVSDQIRAHIASFPTRQEVQCTDERLQKLEEEFRAEFRQEFSAIYKEINGLRETVAGMKVMQEMQGKLLTSLNDKLERFLNRKTHG